MSDKRRRGNNKGRAVESSADRESGEIKKKRKNDEDNQFCSPSNKHASEASSSSPGALTFGRNPVVRSMLRYKGMIGGMTILDGDLYVVEGDMFIRVHDANTLIEKPYLNIAGGVFNPCGLAGSSQSKALYIIDEHISRVFRLPLDTKILTSWDLKANYEPQGISVTSQQNILVTEYMCDAPKGKKGKNIIQEFTSEGQQVREIILDESMRYPFHALKLPSEQLLVGHGDGHSKSHCRICVINTEGQIIKSFGKQIGSGKNQLNWPRALAVDDKGDVIFLADQQNHRIVMFSKDLQHLGQVQINEELHHPIHIFFDSKSERLYVAHHFDRVLIITNEDE